MIISYKKAIHSCFYLKQDITFSKFNLRSEIFPKMADEEEKKTDEAPPEEGSEEQEGADSSKKKTIIIIIIALLFIGAAGGAGFYFLSKSPDVSEEFVDEHVAEESAPVPSESHYFELPDMTVNLSSSSGSRFLRLKVVLEVGSAEDLAKLEKVRPRIIDDFQVYLRELRPEDLRGSAGSYRLRHDLLLRANQAAQPARVLNVLFKEFLVQ